MKTEAHQAVAAVAPSSKQRPENDIQFRLQEWAMWREMPSPSCYPSETVEYRIRVGTANIDRGNAKSEGITPVMARKLSSDLAFDLKCRDINRVYRELQPEYRQVIEVTYCGTRNNEPRPERESAGLLDMTREKYRALRLRVECWMAGRIGVSI